MSVQIKDAARKELLFGTILSAAIIRMVTIGT